MRFSLAIRVYYEDTDAGGVVYYANYLKYFERGRSEALRELGFEQDKLISENDTIFAVRSLQVEYQKPARFNDALTVLTTAAAVKRAELAFEHTIARAAEPRPLVTAVARIACLSAATFKPKPIPPAIARALASAMEA